MPATFSRVCGAVARAALLSILMLVTTQAWAQSLTVPASVVVDVKSRPLEAFDLRDRSRQRFGQLDFRSGLVLTSSFKGFGGLSAFRVDAKGEGFIAMNDKGDWFTGRLAYSGKTLSGLTDVRSAPMLGADGRPITTKKMFDSESLAIDGMTLYVGIERANRILKFDFRQGGIASRGEEVAVPPAFRRLPFNKGPEGLVFVPKGMPLEGTLLAFSERGLDAAGNLIAFPDRRRKAGTVRGPPHRRLRCQRRGAAADGRHPDPGAKVLDPVRRRHPHPQDSAAHDRARCGR